MKKLLAFVAVGLTSATLGFLAGQQSVYIPQPVAQKSGQQVPVADPFDANELLILTNAERQKAGLAALTIDPRLNQSATAKCTDMTKFDYWAHDNPNGTVWPTFIQATEPNYKTAGENLAFGFMNAQTTVTGWMNSQEHRTNILNPAFTKVGFAHCPGTLAHPNIIVQHLTGV